MKPGEDILKELQEITSADAFSSGNKNLFEVPEGYFEALPDAILDTVRTQHKGEGDNISSPDEIQRISLMLASLKKKETLSVPVDYFNTFSNTVLEKLNKPEAVHKTPVISLHKKQAWTRYAAAAVVTGFIGISAIFMFNTSTPAKVTDANLVSQKTNKAGGSDGFNEVSDGALSNYLSTAPAQHEAMLDSADAEFYNIALLDINDKDLADIMQQIPDEDLMSYEDEIQSVSGSL